MFDLNEPADEPQGGSAKKRPAEDEDSFAGLSLLAQSAHQQQEPELQQQQRQEKEPQENVSSAAMEWSLGGANKNSGISSQEKLLSHGSRSARSLEMILEEDEIRPEPPKADEQEQPICEFLAIGSKNPDEVSDAPEIDLIDAFGHEQAAAAAPPAAKIEKLLPEDSSKTPADESGEALDDPKFGSLIWRGGLKFQDVTLPNMLAACSSRWLHLFNNRKLPGELRVQRFTSSEKFVCAIKEFMAEPAVRVMQSSSTSPQNLNKLVQVLAGGIDSELSLNGAGAGKGPLVALIPVHDEANVWLADLHLLTASQLSDVEPGELSSPDEDLLYGFLSVSQGKPDEGFAWLKEENLKSSGAAMEVDEKPPPPPVQAVAPTGLKVKKPPPKREDKELEEGQVVIEEQSGKEAPASAAAAGAAAYERRKRYAEEEKKAKVNGGDPEAKARERHRVRDHDRDRDGERDRVRRERDREVDQRERDRENVYARRGGNHEYLPRLETKPNRHRDGEKTWENGRGPSTKERGREVERSKSREREREKPGNEKTLKETRSTKGGMKAPETTKGKAQEGEKKRRERSPMDSHRGNGKRVKESSELDEHKVMQLAEKLAAFTEEKTGLKNNSFPDALKKKGKVARNESEEPEASLANAQEREVVVDDVDNEVYLEMFVESCDDETRSWLASKQNAVFLREDFGVTLLRKEPSSSDLTKAEREPLHLKLLVPISELCDAAEGKYFVARAASVLRDVCRSGVFSKTLWYPGPVQPYTSAPAVHLVVRRLKGDDGKSLDRIQESTGVLLGVVLDADNKKSKSAVVGIRLKTSRKKGLVEATKKIRELLLSVSQTFSKELEIPAEVNLIEEGTPKPPRVLYVTNLPEYGSVRMLKAIFEKLQKLKKEPELGPPGFEQQPASDTVAEIRYSSEEGCAFVEFTTEELLEGALELYRKDQSVFCGLKVEPASPAEMKIYEQLGGEAEPPAEVKKRGVGAAGESEESEAGKRKGIKPLFLTELGNETSESIQQLFEDVIMNHINPSLDTKSLVLAVRHIPTRGCMFVDLATPELVDFMLDLHFKEPEVFGHMKMELGRSHIPAEVVDRKRNFDRTRSERGLSPRPKRRAEMDDDEDGFGRPRKQRSDPEKTVYADRLPENSSDSVIRKIFRGVLLEHMSPQQRSELGDEVVTEVRHVRMKYCAFVVFASEDLARLALELYSRDEEIFDHMRLKPHFNSRLEDIYKGDEAHDRDDDSVSFEHKSEYEFHETSGGGGGGNGGGGGRGVGRGGGGGGGSGERPPRVDRKRSVYVDRIPDSYHEAELKEVLDRFLRRRGRGSPAHAVNHVSFFRDKYDSSKLCAFVEVKNENAVQDLLDFYAQDEEAFDGMRIRPALKYQ